MANYGTVHRVTLDNKDLNILVNVDHISNKEEVFNEGRIFGRALYENEYFVVFNKHGDFVEVYKKRQGSYEPINRLAYAKLFKGLGPTQNNYEQMCVVDAMLDDSIDMLSVTGNAGTGKSFIILLTAMYMNYNYKKAILYTREIVQAGRDMGFLKGDIDKKTEPFWIPAKMTLNKIQATRGKLNMEETEYGAKLKLEEQGVITFTPLQFLRGTSIDNKIMFNDEAQNEDLETLQMFCTRAEKNSKVVLAGSTRQVDENSLRREVKNGLCCMNAIMKGEPNFAHIILVKQERHRLAQQIDDRVEMFKQGKIDRPELVVVPS